MTSHEEKEINRIGIEIENLEEEKKFFYILEFFKQTKLLMSKIGIDNIILYRANGLDNYNGLKFKYKKTNNVGGYYRGNQAFETFDIYRVNKAFETFDIKMTNGWYIVQDSSSLKADEFNFTKDLLFDEFLKKCFPPKYAIIFLNDKIEKQFPLKDEPEARKIKL